MGEIHIHGLEFKNSRIANRVEASKDVESFIRNSVMFVEYDDKIFADKSVLNIPLTATVLPLAWLSGSDVFVDKIDRRFKESMDNIQEYFKSMYPLIPFKTRIIADELVENSTCVVDTSRETGLLFSGGVDSAYSLITNLERHPRLIMHWGVERTPYPEYPGYWEMVYDYYSEFAQENNLSFNMTKSNACRVLDERRIEHRYHKELFYGSFWVRLQHSFVLLSLTAPLSVKRFNRLLIAASGWSYDMPAFNPYPQVAATDEKIKWADLEVKHDGYIERYQKVEALSSYYRGGVKLRVCLEREKESQQLNCSDCEKCYRTIAQLAQAGVDPVLFGFNVDSSTWDNMRRHHLDKKELVWSDLNIKERVPEKVVEDFYGSRKYFEWLRDFKPEGRPGYWGLKDLYYSLPYNLAKLVDKGYRILGVNIHEKSTPDLPEEKIRYLSKIIKDKNPEWLDRYARVSP